MEKTEKLEEYLDDHYINRSNWLRAAVLGANDGILSTASLAIWVAAASDIREPIILATLAWLVAWALSMAAGEYVSVSSQTDIEAGDIEREKKELEEMPELELKMLTKIYEERWLKKETALLVAQELTDKDALAAHMRDELWINEVSKANPFQAAIASGLSFTVWGILPFIVVLFLPVQTMEYSLYIASILFLALLWAISAKAGWAHIPKAVARITFWGTVAMWLTALVGYIFWVNLA